MFPPPGGVPAEARRTSKAHTDGYESLLGGVWEGAGLSEAVGDLHPLGKAQYICKQVGGGAQAVFTRRLTLLGPGVQRQWGGLGRPVPAICQRTDWLQPDTSDKPPTSELI